MRKLFLMALLVSSCHSYAQEAGDLNPKDVSQQKYGYTHETFFSEDGSYSAEEWVHVRMGDLTGSVEMTQKDQIRLSLNTTVGKLINAPAKGFNNIFHKVQVEGRADTKRADYFLLGSEVKLAGRLTLFAAFVVNDAKNARPLLGPYYYYGPKSYSAVLLYTDKDFGFTDYSVSLRNHFDFEKMWVEANAQGKVSDGHTMYGGQLKGGIGILSAKYEYSPKYEGSNLDRSLYGVEASFEF